MPEVYRRIRETQVDGVLIGRAAAGNPWLFTGKEQVKQAFRGNGTITLQPAVSPAERFSVILEHSRHYENDVQNHCFDGMRSHLLWYCRDLPGAAVLRAPMVRVKSAADVARVLESYAQGVASQLA
jgi:tRNA-dihydrouridine synthase